MSTLGYWLHEASLKQAETFLRLDVTEDEGHEWYAVFYLDHCSLRWHRVSEWMPYEQAMEDLQGVMWLIFGYAIRWSKSSPVVQVQPCSEAAYIDYEYMDGYNLPY